MFYAKEKEKSGTRSGLSGIVALLALAAIAIPWSGGARAQSIAVVVNGDPVTNIDVEQRMKLLRVLHKPATRDAAIESMINDRLEAHEASHFGVVIKDSEIGEGVSLDATRLKTSTTQLLDEIQKAGVQRDHILGYFKAELGYFVIVKELNKGVEASESAVRAELAKMGGKNSITEYTVRQVVFTLDPGDSQAVVAERAKAAEALRARFSNCAEGIPYAKTLTGVAVREEFSRTSTTLPGPLKELLDKTPIGHLTPPSRTTSGFELIAVCGRGPPKDDTDLRKQISDRLVQAHLDEDMTAKLKDMRKHAVIEKR